MGAGHRAARCAAGARTLLHDPVPEALERGAERSRRASRRAPSAGAGREDARAAAARAGAGDALERPRRAATLVIEAAPERLELKRELFARARRASSRPTRVLATNTSSIPVTAIAARRRAARARRRHALLQPGAADAAARGRSPASSPARRRSRSRARTGEAMGKRVIDAADGPGFLVNRCNRPFGLEALRLRAGAASPTSRDRPHRAASAAASAWARSSCRTSSASTSASRSPKSFYELSFGEPRWRPSPLSARMVAAGRTAARPAAAGTTTRDGRRTAPTTPSRRRPAAAARLVVDRRRQRAGRRAAPTLAARRGLGRRAPERAPTGEVPCLIVDCGRDEDDDAARRAARGAAVRRGLARRARPGGQRGRLPRAAAARRARGSSS